MKVPSHYLLQNLKPLVHIPFYIKLTHRLKLLDIDTYPNGRECPVAIDKSAQSFLDQENTQKELNEHRLLYYPAYYDVVFWH